MNFENVLALAEDHLEYLEAKLKRCNDPKEKEALEDKIKEFKAWVEESAEEAARISVRWGRLKNRL